jgi:serine protease Do
VAQLKDDEQKVASIEDKGATGSVHSYGLALSPLSKEARARFDVADDVRGVLIVGVQDGGPAASQGLQPGDVIEKVGADKVSGPAQVKHDMEHEAESGKKTALLLVNRHGASIYVALGLAAS